MIWLRVRRRSGAWRAPRRAWYWVLRSRWAQRPCAMDHGAVLLVRASTLYLYTLLWPARRGRLSPVVGLRRMCAQSRARPSLPVYPNEFPCSALAPSVPCTTPRARVFRTASPCVSLYTIHTSTSLPLSLSRLSACTRLGCRLILSCRLSLQAGRQVKPKALPGAVWWAAA